MSKTTSIITLCLSNGTDARFYIDSLDPRYLENLQSFYSLKDTTVDQVMSRKADQISLDEWREAVATGKTQLGYDIWVNRQ